MTRKDVPEDVQETGYAPVVAELAELLASDAAFRRRVEEAMRRRDDKAGDPWRERSVEDFCRTFDDWLTAMPVLEDEQTFLDDLLTFHRTPEALALVREEPLASWLNRFARARGAFLDGAASVPMVEHWSRHRLIRMDDFVVPEGGFRSFNDFFTRQVKPGARPIAAPDDDAVLISPADCEIQPALSLDPGRQIEVKRKSLGLRDLLADDPWAAEFENGTAMALFLDVHDYHHFHAPTSGRIVHERKIGGLCFGCDEYPGQFFNEHPRGFFVFDTGFGPLGMVTVGIATVSSIVHCRTAGNDVRKGEELGHFAYGGSAILLLFPPGQVCLDDRDDYEHILMGTRIGVFPSQSSLPNE